MPARPPSFRLRLLALCLAAALPWAAWESWKVAGLRALAADWERAHAARDVAALESLYRWEGVDAPLRARIRAVLAQELDLEVAAVRAARLSEADLVHGPDRRPNGEPLGVIEVRYAAEDGLSARHLAGRDGWDFRLLVIVPVAGP